VGRPCSAGTLGWYSPAGRKLMRAGARSSRERGANRSGMSIAQRTGGSETLVRRFDSWKEGVRASLSGLTAGQVLLYSSTNRDRAGRWLGLDEHAHGGRQRGPRRRSVRLRWFGHVPDLSHDAISTRYSPRQRENPGLAGRCARV